MPTAIANYIGCDIIPLSTKPLIQFHPQPVDDAVDEGEVGGDGAEVVDQMR